MSFAIMKLDGNNSGFWGYFLLKNKISCLNLNTVGCLCRCLLSLFAIKEKSPSALSDLQFVGILLAYSHPVQI